MRFERSNGEKNDSWIACSRRRIMSRHSRIIQFAWARWNSSKIPCRQRNENIIGTLLSEILFSILIRGNQEQSNRRSHVTLHSRRPFLHLRVKAQVGNPHFELVSEFLELIVEKPHYSPLSAPWLLENFFSFIDTRTEAH